MLRGRRLLTAVALLGALACDGAPALECQPETVATDSGLRFRDIRCGRGTPARRGDVVTVRYRGRLEGGRALEPGAPGGRRFTFPLGRGQVIPGWDEGLVGMRPGGERHLVVPPELAFGTAGYPGAVPAGATLVFRVELLEVRARP